MAVLSTKDAPPHFLKLKKGMMVSVVRNLLPAEGILNGTKVEVINILRNTLVCETLEDAHGTRQILLPRITFEIKTEGIIVLRRQFPVRPAYAETINRSQGKTLERIVLDLRSPCFAHGQLYVGQGRSRTAAQTGTVTKEEDIDPTTRSVRAQNVVYQEIISAT
jgi:hypothetical protein